MSKKYISTLEFYNYGESNRMEPALGSSYRVKVSDKDGNIITIEKDDSLYACVKLAFDTNSGVLSLLDVAHNDSVLAEVEMPNADYIYNCRFDEELNAILFDVKSLYGNDTDTIELDVESLVELYEAGQGIEIGEKNEETGRRPISIKLAEGENILRVDEGGLSISDEITTDDELDAAISGKADIDYVDELFGSISGVTSLYDIVSGLTDYVDKIMDIIGTEEDDPNLDERIDSKADREEVENIDDEIGNIIIDINVLSGDVESLKDRVEILEEKTEENSNEISDLNDDVDDIYNDIGTLSGNVNNIENAITDINSNIADLETDIENNKTFIVKITSGLSEGVKEAYVLKNNLGEVLGDEIDIYNDSSIESIEYVDHDDTGKEGQFLKIVYVSSSGGEQTTYIDLSEIVIDAEFADGLEVIDGKAYVKIDPSSDGYLSVSENGIKLSGVYQQFLDLLEVNSQQWSAITGEMTTREEIDNQLFERISAETINREIEDGKIMALLSAETEARESQDNALLELISAETENRIANDNAISAIVDTKIEAEKDRATLAEDYLQRQINKEIGDREAADSDLSDRIDEEISARTASDNSIRQFVYDDVLVPLNTKISGLTVDLGEETRERISADNWLSGEIGTIREIYAKKEYVDARDAEAIITAVTSATTLANQYSDLKNDYLEAELKLYCDTGHTELQNKISENTTKINVISNLKGVSGSDASNYDNSGNGILDVLHREFHEYKGETIHNATGAQIRNVDEVAIGRYNISNREVDQVSGGDIPSGCTIFSVGIGTSDSVRKNALEVRQDGSIYMWVEGEYMLINRLLGMLAHEVYDENENNG